MSSFATGAERELEMDPSAADAGERGSPDDRDPDLENRAELDGEHHTEGEVFGGRGSDPPLPVSPGRRRLASIIAFLLIATILTFLIWFVASNPTRQGSGGMLGTGPEPNAAAGMS